MVNRAPEQGPQSLPPVETKVLAVNQPKKLEGILMEIADLQTESFSESSANGPGNGWSGGGTGAAGGQTASGPTPRDQAIAAIPTPVVMQGALKQHIDTEVRSLRKEAQRITALNQPGSAYKLNTLYGKIRRLHSLLGELLDASADMLKRMFIRVFIDKQPIL